MSDFVLLAVTLTFEVTHPNHQRIPSHVDPYCARPADPSSEVFSIIPDKQSVSPFPSERIIGGSKGSNDDVNDRGSSVGREEDFKVLYVLNIPFRSGKSFRVEYEDH
jgi:hypothetical protein